MVRPENNDPDAGIINHLNAIFNICKEQSNLIVIAIVNDSSKIPAALLSRFTERIIFKNPTSDERLTIIKWYLSKYNHACSDHYSEGLAKRCNEFSIRELESLILKSLRRAMIDTDEKITDIIIRPADLDDAYKQIESEKTKKYRKQLLENVKSWGPYFMTGVNLFFNGCSLYQSWAGQRQSAFFHREQQQQSQAFQREQQNQSYAFHTEQMILSAKMHYENLKIHDYKELTQLIIQFCLANNVDFQKAIEFIATSKDPYVIKGSSFGNMPQWEELARRSIAKVRENADNHSGKIPTSNQHSTTIATNNIDTLARNLVSDINQYVPAKIEVDAPSKSIVATNRSWCSII